ncbi:DUF2855 family protein [Litorimonas sp. RW-G-Af-16]|uniref:DUF2855 family protein n=1 Tax=Litorimonas sp. RW-G-Af-16 TaxID=3241168 RepID=UPI00390CA3E8
MTETLLVKRDDFTDVTIVKAPHGELADGFVRCKVGPWALTANNVTYMVTGHQIGYWHYFNPTDYGINMPEHGRMPVWGFAEVTESKCADVPVGKVVYGFLPITQTFDMKPTRLTSSGFQDGNAHRVPLHSLYNGYTFVDADPSFALNMDLQPILRPLFTTSFLIDDFLADQDFYGAEQVLILSASSKTALGTAFCLRERGGIKVTGLTSEGNKAFTGSTGFYDEVQTYDTITDLNPDVKTVIVDMSGNGKVLQTVADHFEENLTYICCVGMSHWEAGKKGATKSPAKSEFFFAPDRAKLRIGEWGGGGFAQRLGQRWVPFLTSAQDWLEVEKAEGVGPVLKAYQDVLGGTASPDKGYLFTL